MPNASLHSFTGTAHVHCQRIQTSASDIKRCHAASATPHYSHVCALDRTALVNAIVFCA
jgi:hypothetical protein